MKTGFKGLASTVMGVLVWAAFASCTGLGPSDESGAGTSDGGTGSPDLMVASPSVSNDGPAAGAPFTFSATVRNAGDGASESTTLRYYRSTDADISSSDAELGTDAVAELAASATSSQSVSLTAPTTAGTYYYGVCVDAVEGESDTANNCSASVQITVPEPEPGPNLVVSSPSVSNSAPAVGTTFTVSALVRNAGDEASVVTTMRFYQSTDATITTSDVEVGTDTVGGLSPTGTNSPSATSSSQSGMLASTVDSRTNYYHGELELDAPSTPGTYYYGACVDAVTDESDTTNNCSSSTKVTVRSSEQQVPGAPDLNPYTIVVEAGLDGLSPGGSFSLSVGVRNEGDGSSAATTLRYYRSTDATITTSDTEEGTDDLPSLAPSATSTQSMSLTAPTTAGTYYYGACVDAVTGESDTADNCSSSVQVTVQSTVEEPTHPDLQVGTPTVDDSNPEAGATVALSATVSNTGGGASEATTLRFYRSTEETITTTHTEVGTDDVGALAASGTNEGSVSVTVPRSMGRYFYGACVDAVADESDTTNNCSAPVTVTVVAPQQPEGAPSVRIYSASSAVTEGMPVRIGVSATPAPTADLDVYLSYTEYAKSGGQTTYYIWPPLEPKVTITAGSSSTTLTVSSIDDSDADGNSVLYAWLASGSGYTIDSDPFRRTAFVVVVDDDGPAGDSVLSITAVSTSVSEGTAVQFTVSANPAPAAAVTVGYRVSETGSTFSEALDPGWNPGTVTIGAGQSTATLSFDTVDDSTDEEDSEVDVTLRVDTYPDGVELGRPAEAYVTVLDDD